MTNEERKVIELALEALEGFYEYGYDRRECFEHITAIKEALAQPEQEPVACIHRIVDVTNEVVKSGYMCVDCGAVFRAYTSPPKSKPLTDEQIAEMWLEILGSTPPSGIHEDGLQPWRFVRAIEAAHGIKE